MPPGKYRLVPRLTDRAFELVKLAEHYGRPSRAQSQHAECRQYQY